MIGTFTHTQSKHDEWILVVDGASGRWAQYSPCRRYRYALGIPLEADLRDRRRAPWTERKTLLSCGLNPSTATELVDDPTLRLDQRYAREWGFECLVKINEFAFRATDPRDMKRAEDPIGPANDEVIRRFAAIAESILVCWGSNGGFRDRDYAVMDLLRASGKPIGCFEISEKTGFPRHPLMMKHKESMTLYAGRTR